MKQRFVPILYEGLITHLFPVKNKLIQALCVFSLLQCVKINVKDKQIKYFIHYSGWNKK